MAIDWGVWGPPAAVLVAGAVASFFVLNRISGGDARIAEESRRNDLESTRHEVVEALKQLDLDKDKVPPDDYARERAQLLARGARALEALETGGTPAVPAAPAPAVPAAPSPPPPRPSGAIAPEWKGAIYALLTVGILAVLWNFANQNSAPRGDGGMTGSLPGQDQPPPPQPEIDPQDTPEFKARLAELEAALAANPDDAASLNKMTQLYVTHGNPAMGMQYNDRVLKLDAENLDAKVWRAVITAMMGMFDKAVAGFDEVLAKEPQHVLGVTYRGLVLLQWASDEKDPAKRTELAQKAAEGLGLAFHLQPGNKAVGNALLQARSLAGGGGPPAAAAGNLIVSGTLQIDPAAQATLKGTETLYLSVADPARPGGPPVAANRVALTFPQAFELTTDHIRAMPGAGSSVPERVDLKARVDLDGNAMTKEPGTPQAIVAGVTRGQTGVIVTLTLDGAAPAPSGLLAPVQPGGGEVIASGTVKLDPGVKLAGTEVVFVSVRDPAGGPPLASVRLAPSFPLSFSVTSANAIDMGTGPRPVPATVNVAVRIDADGDAMTKDGPEAVAQGVAKGATGLDLTIR